MNDVYADGVLSGILKRVIAEPADDLPRLAYADRLDELGADLHADYIRLSIRRKISDLYHRFLLSPLFAAWSRSWSGVPWMLDCEHYDTATFAGETRLLGKNYALWPGHNWRESYDYAAAADGTPLMNGGKLLGDYEGPFEMGDLRASMLRGFPARVTINCRRHVMPDRRIHPLTSRGGAVFQSIGQLVERAPVDVFVFRFPDSMGRFFRLNRDEVTYMVNIGYSILVTGIDDRGVFVSARLERRPTSNQTDITTDP